ncbi:hypothetical protein HME9302_01709 [Alteripontixanthobacter maritimus]|uniref:Glycosyltransferase subfamily 4-like N-terminal domain-containing protein n=1 Tax=Alteripontixanthobacter maritimus TaxID=2161824 RepID=A0A369Q6K0_9SPHN|nr:glycosyltransferase [Alteripontixanthobacter maritimus]RDC60501.1 hypothetical protein HME9302_01709 [Alteripontixanthobacter maritimus]
MTQRVVLWGTYDLGKPRTRILRDSLRASGFDVVEIHTPVWEGVADKSQLSRVGWLAHGLRWLLAYPGLMWRYLRAPRHDVVVVPYMGHLDVLILWPLARMRGVPIVWDVFLSLYDTVVRDRRMVGPRNPLAWVLRGWEKLACRAADKVVLDTRAHAAMLAELYNLNERKTVAVFVGAETANFQLEPTGESIGGEELQILFYGQFIPLHGIETIIEAARLARDAPIAWHIIGDGQEAPRIRQMLVTDPLPQVRWTNWMAYDELKAEIGQADICLGIFGTSEKSARVIPNKVFQVISAGKPLVTRDSPAMRELVGDDEPGVELIPAGDPQALLDAVKRAADGPDRLDPAIAERFAPDALARQWGAIVGSVLATKG